MVPKYSGRLMDKLMLIVAGQTGLLRENCDETAYAVKRGTVLETVTWTMWEARERLQQRRRELAKKSAKRSED